MPKARQDIQANESSQASEINQKVANYKHDKQNYDDYSGYKGDTSKLDASVQKAQNTAGLTVIKDADHVQAPVDASDDQAINNTKDKIQKDTDGQIPSIENAIVTQERNNQAWAKFEQELAEYRKEHSGANPDGVSTAEIVQALELGREPQAKVSVSQLKGTAGRIDTNMTQNTDSTSYEYYITPGATGVVLVATYTNLQHSYYTDDNGNKHNIAKIVRTFSDLTKQNWISSWDYLKNPENNANPYLWIYDDPTDGFWYYYASGVTVTDQYFDEYGNPVNLNDDAWLAVTSLNNIGGTADQIANNAHVEQVTPLSGGQSYALLGSSVTNHNGTLYADLNNTSGTGMNDGHWDSKGSEEYYGAGLVKLSSGTTSLRFTTHRDPTFTGATPSNVWATTTTILPVTPGPDKPSVPRYSTVHYHNDVMTVNPPTLAQSRVTPQYHDLFSQTDVQKHYSENNIQTDNKLYIAGDTAHADVSVKLLNASDYEGGLNKLSFDDDYSNFASHAKVNVDQSKVTHDGQDITSDFTITVHGNCSNNTIT